jgi:hypothetical protein
MLYIHPCVYALKSWYHLVVGHTCNPSYSGGRDQEDHGSKTVWANSSRDPVSNNPSQERAGGVAQGVGPEIKPSTTKKKKERKKRKKNSR